MPALSLLSRERTVARPGFNRWLVPPAALAIHVSIGQAYAWSVFNAPPVRSAQDMLPRELPMPNLPWLDGYSGQTSAELIALEGQYRTDSLVLAFEQAMHLKAARVGEDKLTAEEHVILAVEFVEREVNNGGYAQLFVNASCDSVREMVEALRRIGCPITAEITHRALTFVQASRTTTDEVKNHAGGVNNDLHAVLGECDSRYFARPENIEESLFAFIRAYRRTIEA